MRCLSLVMLLCLLSLPVQAAFQGPGVTPTVTTAAQAKAAADDTPCVLEGSIVEKLSGEDDDYRFADASGDIVVEIDDEVFAGRTITSTTRVRLLGKVDKEIVRANTVEVKQLDIL